MIVGHNPGIAEIANQLAGCGRRGRPGAHGLQISRPRALAVLEFLRRKLGRDRSRAAGRLLRFVAPVGFRLKARLIRALPCHIAGASPLDRRVSRQASRYKTRVLFLRYRLRGRRRARSLLDYVQGGALRLGVTGLSRAGKTVFVTALIQNLIAGTRLPVLAASAEGRIARARLDPQPDDAVPRFPLRGASGRARRPGSPLAAIDAAHLAAAPDDRIRARGRLGRGPLDAQPRHRRLSRRMAARPAAAGKDLCAMVARNDRGEPDAGARAAGERVGGPARGLDPTAPRRRGRRARAAPRCSPLISGARATTSTRFRPCRRAGS